MEPQKTKKNFYNGIDYLRAFFSVCIVIAHLGYFAPSLIFDPVRYVDHTFVFSDVVNFYVFGAGVPVFFFISTYLFGRREYNWDELKGVLARYVLITVFWMFASAVFSNAKWDILVWFPTNLRELVVFIVKAGNTIYYFFLSLILYTILTHFLKLLSTRLLIILFFLSSLFLGLVPIIAQVTGIYYFAAYYMPFNFAPYPFAAMVLVRLEGTTWYESNRYRLVFVSFVLGVLTAILDWTVYQDSGFFLGGVVASPAFARPALIFFGLSIFILFTSFQPRRYAVVKFMAKYSLALYLIHPFFLPLMHSHPEYGLGIKLLVTVIGSYLMAWLLSFGLRRELLF